jgi:glycine cleavage system H protein
MGWLSVGGQGRLAAASSGRRIANLGASMSVFFMESHEWARLDGDEVVVGISSFAAGEVGEVIHVELPEAGAIVTKGEACAEIESVKSVNDFYAPVDGTVVKVNEALGDAPELVNAEAEAGGWFFTIKPSADEPLAGLMDQAAYDAHIRG